jgi:hypothetical protein
LGLEEWGCRCGGEGEEKHDMAHGGILNAGNRE